MKMAGTEQTGNHRKLKWQKTASSLLLVIMKLTNANATSQAKALVAQVMTANATDNDVTDSVSSELPEHILSAFWTTDN